MAHKTKINGVSYTVNGGKALVDGTTYTIANGQTLREGTAYHIGFGVPISTLAVGDSVYFQVNGVSTEFIIVHMGLPNGRIYDASCDGVWVLMKDIYENRAFDAIQLVYASSAIHEYLNSTFLGLLGASVQAGIKEVKIPHVYGSSVKKGSNGLSAKVFLLSVIELGASDSVSNIVAQEGYNLDYFRGADSFFNYDKRVANLNGVPAPWWTRSPLKTMIGNVWNIKEDGGRTTNHYTSSLGVRPAFILPTDFRV